MTRINGSNPPDYSSRTSATDAPSAPAAANTAPPTTPSTPPQQADGVEPGFFTETFNKGQEWWKANEKTAKLGKELVELGVAVVTANIPGIITNTVDVYKAAVADAGPDGQAPPHDPQELKDRVDGSKDYNHIDKDDQELIDGGRPANTTHVPQERYT